jgi:hypothetical protein
MVIIVKVSATGQEYEEFPIGSPMAAALRGRGAPARQQRVESRSVGRHFPKPIIPGKPNLTAVWRPTEWACQAHNGQFASSCSIAPDDIEVSVLLAVDHGLPVRGPGRGVDQSVCR